MRVREVRQSTLADMTGQCPQTIFVLEVKCGDSYPWGYEDAFQEREEALDFANAHMRYWPLHTIRIVEFHRANDPWIS